MAKIILADGKEVYRDGSGRYRDVHTGKYLPKAAVEERIRGTQREQTAREAARQGILEAVRKNGASVETVEEAWAQLVQVQTEIALNFDQGSKATTALKFLGSISGLDVVEDEVEMDLVGSIDPETARIILELLQEIENAKGEKSDNSD